MKQTAVEWLIEQMFGEHTKAWQKQIDKALAMEKEQTINFAEGYLDWATDENSQAYDSSREAIIDYYNTNTP